MIQYEIEARPFVDADIEAAFDWYEAEQAGLGVEFLAELRATYRRILGSPFKVSRTPFRHSAVAYKAIPIRNLFLGRGVGYCSIGGPSHSARSR